MMWTFSLERLMIKNGFLDGTQVWGCTILGK